jgi:hypothetical protein
MIGIKSRYNEHLKMKPEVMLQEAGSDIITVICNHCLRNGDLYEYVAYCLLSLFNNICINYRG